jgi:hypothetical protein
MSEGVAVSDGLFATAQLSASPAFSVSSPSVDNEQKTSRQNIGLLGGIVGGALLLILLVAILIWQLLGRSRDTATSSLALEQGMGNLDLTEDIDFGSMTYATNPVKELPTELSLVEPDESLTSVKSIVDDFL